MTPNTGQYCLVDTSGVDFVVEGPKLLPANWISIFDGITYANLNDKDHPTWSIDDNLVAIGWYPTTINVPVYDPVTQYLGDYQFIIHVDNVVAEREILDKSQEQIDKEKDISIAETQRQAVDLVDQTERILRQNTQRLEVGADPLIPAEDVEDVKTYIKTLYDAMDDDAHPLIDPPAATRQITEVQGERRDRMLVRWESYEVNTLPYSGLVGTLYAAPDVEGISLQVRDANGLHLWTQPFIEISPGVWESVPQNASNMWPDPRQDRGYNIYKGTPISQFRAMPADIEEQVFDVRWSNGTITQGARR